MNRVAHSADDLLVDRWQAAVVRGDGDNDSVIVCGPDDQHPIGAVEVAAADLLKQFARQPVAARRTPA